MPDFIRKPIATSLNANQQGAASQAVKRQTRAWPCTVVSVSGSIVTVNFEVQSQWTVQHMTMPLFGPEYIRYPIQPGCKGYAMPADTTLGNMSGLGPATPPDLSQPPNLTSLVFMPIGGTYFAAPVDPNKIELYGPAGFVIHDTASHSVITGTTSEITIVRGSTTITMDGANVNITGTNVTINGTDITLNGATTINGTLSQGLGSSGGTAALLGPITVTNDVVAGGISVKNHVHGGVQSGSSDTDPPTG
jgi:phage baseplate assembly protein gpV